MFQNLTFLNKKLNLPKLKKINKKKMLTEEEYLTARKTLETKDIKNQKFFKSKYLRITRTIFAVFFIFLAKSLQKTLVK